MVAYLWSLISLVRRYQADVVFVSCESHVCEKRQKVFQSGAGVQKHADMLSSDGI